MYGVGTHLPANTGKSRIRHCKLPQSKELKNYVVAQSLSFPRQNLGFINDNAAFKLTKTYLNEWIDVN